MNNITTKNKTIIKRIKTYIDENSISLSMLQTKKNNEQLYKLSVNYSNFKNNKIDFTLMIDLKNKMTLHMNNYSYNKENSLHDIRSYDDFLNVLNTSQMKGGK